MLYTNENALFVYRVTVQLGPRTSYCWGF